MTSFGRPRRHYRITESTNSRASELAEAGAPSGTVVTAEEQTAGRGRHGRRWAAPPGGALLLSALVRPLELGHRLLPLAVPLAVCEGVESLAPVRCEVKWPNDLWIERRKVGGVLIEARPPEWAVIGIGLNLAIEPKEFAANLRWPATSVGHDVTVEAALADVCEALGRWVGAPEERVLAQFRERDALREHRVSWEGKGEGGEGSGVAEGIDEEGNLVVRTGSGEVRHLGSGEVTLRPDQFSPRMTH